MPAPTLRLHPEDGVAIARATLLPGTPVGDGLVDRGIVLDDQDLAHGPSVGAPPWKTGAQHLEIV